MPRTLTLAACATLLMVVSVRAQNTTTTTQDPINRPQNNAQTDGTAAKAAVNDALFAAAAASGGLAEVTISELGQQRATDPELKKFSQQMVQDHTRLNGELTTLAAQKRVALPRATDFRAQFCAQSLAGLSGEQFDHCYAKAQLISHSESVALFEAEAERGQDPDLKAFAAKNLPRIKEHLKMIKPIAMKYEKEKKDHHDSSAEKTETEKPK